MSLSRGVRLTLQRVSLPLTFLRTTVLNPAEAKMALLILHYKNDNPAYRVGNSCNSFLRVGELMNVRDDINDVVMTH